MRRRDAAQGGQTLLEAIVAIGVLSTAIVAALSLAVASLAAEQVSLDQVTAGNLAREGIEVVRLMRDGNWLANREWDDGLYDAAGSLDYDGAPRFDPQAGTWAFAFGVDQLTDAGAIVYRHTGGDGGAVVGLFRQASAAPGGAVDSGFRRLVTMNPICEDASGNLAVITSGTCPADGKVGVQALSSVRWQSAGRVHELTVEERMYDWY
jgi:type II secretory pathway pseudopilin PulG